MNQLFSQLQGVVTAWVDPAVAVSLPRGEVARRVTDNLISFLDAECLDLDLLDQRNLVTLLINYILEVGGKDKPAPKGSSKPDGPVLEPIATAEPVTDLAGSDPPHQSTSMVPRPSAPAASSDSKQSDRKAGTPNTISDAKAKIKPLVMERIDVTAASHLDHQMLVRELSDVVAEIRDEMGLQLNSSEFAAVLTALVDDMIGFGPLEALLADTSIADIMVNGPNQVYVERG
ncbi:MAG: hypothetical protein AAGF58_05625, partial [Pseudomonadota bacterium]